MPGRADSDDPGRFAVGVVCGSRAALAGCHAIQFSADRSLGVALDRDIGDLATVGPRRLANLPQWSGLSPEIRSKLEAMGRLRKYRAGQTIMPAGDRPEFVGCTIGGFLSMQKTLNDGRQHIVGLLVEGDMFGLLTDGGMNLAIEAATDAEICAFPRTAFESLLWRSPELDRMVLLNVLNELDRARDWMVILANPRVRGRLAGFLLVMSTRFAGVDHVLNRDVPPIEIRIPISRSDMAHLLGTRPESISRAFHALARDGTIALLRPDLIQLRDLDALAAEAGEEAPALHKSLKDVLAGRRLSG